MTTHTAQPLSDYELSVIREAHQNCPQWHPVVRLLEHIDATQEPDTED